ncbi:MAG: hypothetical protein Greene041679_682, partial [Parcubacteria group bacterium Greene0416_79]
MLLPKMRQQFLQTFLLPFCHDPNSAVRQILHGSRYPEFLRGAAREIPKGNPLHRAVYDTLKTRTHMRAEGLE